MCSDFQEEMFALVKDERLARLLLSIVAAEMQSLISAPYPTDADAVLLREKFYSFLFDDDIQFEGKLAMFSQSIEVATHTILFADE